MGFNDASLVMIAVGNGRGEGVRNLKEIHYKWE
jgi:hypothetical protein